MVKLFKIIDKKIKGINGEVMVVSLILKKKIKI